MNVNKNLYSKKTQWEGRRLHGMTLNCNLNRIWRDMRSKVFDCLFCAMNYDYFWSQKVSYGKRQKFIQESFVIHEQLPETFQKMSICRPNLPDFFTICGTNRAPTWPFQQCFQFFFYLPGPNVKIAIAILNCILARQLCFEDPSCSAILEIIPRVCGPVPGKWSLKVKFYVEAEIKL